MTQRSGANTEKDASASPGEAEASGSTAAGTLAAELASGHAGISIEETIHQLNRGTDAMIEQAARVVEELATQKPELLAPHIDTFVALLATPRPHGPNVQAAVHSLPILARVTPAKVAKHLKTLQAAFPNAAPIAKDGLVRTFVALCVASVTYQKRLIENFELALRTADAEHLPRWVEHILPALKGEPYAQARAVVEQRLNDPQLDRSVAQHVADTIGVKLRIAPERR